MNRQKLTRGITVGMVTAVLVFSMVGVPVLAATASQPSIGGGQALEIAPPLINLNANPGQTIQAQIKLRDVSTTDLIVSNEIDDFVADGESGNPKILLNGSGNDPYSMKDWVTPVPQMTLKPQEIRTINVTINVPKDASPGGHYSVIRFTGAAPVLGNEGPSRVAISASLGSLILLTVSGNIKENLSISQFAVGKMTSQGTVKTGSFFRNTPLAFVEKIKNTGNLQEQPTGIVTVTDMFGHKVAAMEVNQPPHNILPSSTRQFIEQMDKSVIGKKHFFGRYTAKVELTYGKGNKVLTASLSFWVIPWILILVIIAALIIVFFIFRYLLRSYKRRILAQAQGNAKTTPSSSRKSKNKR